ncbi:MAG: stage 0 sporulation family protein [Deltaproteobacteria bacterium]|nr:stage 0 sporulation family protein [Deltaproteobacteria bacterium]
MLNVTGVRFKKASKVYNFNAGEIELKYGDMVIVEVEKGIGLARVVVAPEPKPIAEATQRLKSIVRKADAVDLERSEFNKEREQTALVICKKKILKYKLSMKLVSVEYLFDSSKAIFYFTSEARVDFRELVKDLAGTLFTRIEMRQIGVRDEAKLTGGIGSCGRELCCSSFLGEFEPVTVRMAKEQNIALNPLKISGVCGRLMCCLGFEYGGSKKDCEKHKGAGGGKGCSSKHGKPSGSSRGGKPTQHGKSTERSAGAGEGKKDVTGRTSSSGSKPITRERRPNYKNSDRKNSENRRGSENQGSRRGQVQGQSQGSTQRTPQNAGNRNVARVAQSSKEQAPQRASGEGQSPSGEIKKTITEEQSANQRRGRRRGRRRRGGRRGGEQGKNQSTDSQGSSSTPSSTKTGKEEGS